MGNLFVRVLLLSIGMVFIYGCGTAKEIVINSTPEMADVYIKEIGSNKIEHIGKTPLTLGEDIIKKKINVDKGPVMFEVTRPGHIKQQIIVNDLGKTSVKYDFNLKSNNVGNIITKIDDAGSKLFEVQRLIRAGGYDSSLKMLNKLDSKYPYSSIINELKGSIYYLKKDYQNSLVYYDMACKYNMNNVDAFKMKKYLEKELGVKRPLAKGVKQ